MTSTSMPGAEPRRALSSALLVLALSAFAIGTSEFVIVGLLPNVASDLGVSIPGAGWLVTGYALGVAIGAPIMAIATAKLPRRTALLGLMGIFIGGNILCAFAPGYGVMMAARVVTALCHGAFFGIGAVLAASLAPVERRASAIAMMFMGLTLANVLGVPLGTALGQAAGWRATFWAVTVTGLLAFAGLALALPSRADETPPRLSAELVALMDGRIWRALATTALFSASFFALFTYIAPYLHDVVGLGDRGVAATLLVMGVGLTVGNVLGGRLADRRREATLLAALGAMAVCALVLYLAGAVLALGELLLFTWAIVGFGAAPALQLRVVAVGHRAPNLISTLNIGAFNVGNALGAWLGGMVLSHGFGLPAVTITSAIVAAVTLASVLLWPVRA